MQSVCLSNVDLIALEEEHIKLRRPTADGCRRRVMRPQVCDFRLGAPADLIEGRHHRTLHVPVPCLLFCCECFFLCLLSLLSFCMACRLHSLNQMAHWCGSIAKESMKPVHSSMGPSKLAQSIPRKRFVTNALFQHVGPARSLTNGGIIYVSNTHPPPSRWLSTCRKLQLHVGNSVKVRRDHKLASLTRQLLNESTHTRLCCKWLSSAAELINKSQCPWTRMPQQRRRLLGLMSKSADTLSWTVTLHRQEEDLSVAWHLALGRAEEAAVCQKRRGTNCTHGCALA
mmetsp:Transcript_57834/g.108862  ORF Transcript_57834/g.108862 Transcript_57834/m.108862 type:complete len:285 (-) Transcript_57834:1019-1873(-)